jgi:hypothetical protein
LESLYYKKNSNWSGILAIESLQAQFQVHLSKEWPCTRLISSGSSDFTRYPIIVPNATYKKYESSKIYNNNNKFQVFGPRFWKSLIWYCSNKKLCRTFLLFRNGELFSSKWLYCNGTTHRYNNLLCLFLLV